MKSIIPFIAALLIVGLCHGQQVPVGTDGELYFGIGQSVDDWHARYSPALHGYPLAMEVELTANMAMPFHFRDAQRVVLVVEPGANGRLTCTGSDGKVLAIRNSGAQQQLLDLPAAKFSLLYEQHDGKEDAALEISRVYIVPKNDPAKARDFGFSTSLDCHPNANCPDGDRFSDQVRSTARIMMVLEEGIGWCTGTLINNTERDGRPLILSAEHCLAGYTPIWNLWRFDFNYTSDNCMDPNEEPVANSITGATLLSKHRDTDFMLLELNESVPVFFNAYFSGWNRTPDYAPGQSVLIHHPSGDIAKMSTDFHQITLWENSLIWNEGYTTPEETHYRNRFDAGTFEPGSSGGAIYDTSAHIIAQLHGGIGDCNANTAYSGRLAASWDWGADANGRLMDWLDPRGMDTMILDGMEHPDAGNVYHVTGIVRNPAGQPVRDVEILLGGAVALSVDADSNGVFVLPELPRSSEVIFKARKNTNPRNGVSATDLLLIKKHLLGDTPFAENWQVLASDATGNDAVSAGDILILQKLLLGLVSVLPTQDAWIFDPPQISILDPVDSDVQLEFTAIKVGDVNGTADPNQ